MDNVTTVSIKELSDAIRLIVQKAHESGVNEFELDDDFFWEIHFDDSLNLDTQPEDIGLAQYHDDLLELRDLLKGAKTPGSFDLVRVGNLLRYIGYKHGF